MASLSPYVEAKARRLLDTGAVTQLHIRSHLSTATIEGDNGTYNTIIYPDGTYTCACEWGRYYSHTLHLCSHARALQLATERSKAQ